MKITMEILEGFLSCKTKGYLKLNGQVGTRSDYEAMTEADGRAARTSSLAAIAARHGDGDVPRATAVTAAALEPGPPLLVDAILEDDGLSIRFDALMRADGPSILGGHHYLPVLHRHADKVGRQPRLLLAVLGLLLQRVQAHRPAVGLVAHGPGGRPRKVRLDARLYREAEQFLDEVGRLQAGGEPPRLMLNKHCQACEFRLRCRERAEQADDISLLAGVGEKELRRYNRKGIFTLAQLACTFRPRKRARRVKRSAYNHSAALQALAIREKKIHVHGTPEVPRKPVQIFLDAEGNSDGSFVYLLGLHIVAGKDHVTHAFWADRPGREAEAFGGLLDVLDGREDVALFFYGSYETRSFRRMRRVVMRSQLVDRLLAGAVNILAVIHSHVYSPTFTNGLKDVAGYLGSTWADPSSSGLQSLVWRARWEQTGDVIWKEKLLTYNAEDRAALRRVTECVQAIGEAARLRGVEASSVPPGPPVAWADELVGPSSRRESCRARFPLPDFDHIDRCAYFDYQREKVFLRTNRAVRRVCTGPRKERSRRLRTSREVELRDDACPACGGARVARLPEKTCSKLAFDLEFGRGGIRRRVIRCTGFWHWCEDCRERFEPVRHKRRDRFLHGLKSWAMAQHVVHRVNLSHLRGMLPESFGLSVDRGELQEIRALMAARYRKTCDQIRARIVGGGLAHADETEVKLQREEGYVWVLTNREDVLYLYKPSREAGFLHELLEGFKGVLVSDFYSGYDSLDCPQQKCLVHLIRDLNADLLGNPYDEELKDLAGGFGRLLRGVVETIDEQGLKQEYLRRHEPEVSGFFRDLEARSYRSEVADSYRLRLTRCRGKLFTFLEHDGVTWNNNPAEHAVKAFARFRRTADGLMGEAGLSDYLALLSVQQTCKYRGVSFLEFLLSQEEDVAAFCRRGRRKNPPSTIEVYPEGFPRGGRQRSRDGGDTGGGAPGERIGYWRPVVLAYLRDRAECGASLRDIADHCVGRIKDGTLLTAVSADDRRRVDQNVAQFLRDRRKVGEVERTPDGRFRITARGLGWLERRRLPS